MLYNGSPLFHLKVHKLRSVLLGRPLITCGVWWVLIVGWGGGVKKIIGNIRFAKEIGFIQAVLDSSRSWWYGYSRLPPPPFPNNDDHWVGTKQWSGVLLFFETNCTNNLFNIEVKISCSIIKHEFIEKYWFEIVKWWGEGMEAKKAKHCTLFADVP